MRTSGQLFFGVLVILFGVILLVANVVKVDLWTMCWPTFLILLGVWLIARPRIERSFPNTHILLIGDYDQAGVWQVASREHWSFVGDYDLDMLQANIPSGETHLRYFGFVHEIKLITPPDVGVSVSSASFVSEVRLFGEKHESFFIPLEQTSTGYAAAERKIRIECFGFVTTVKVRTVTASTPS